MIRVVTDTTSCLSLAEYEKYGIAGVPLYVREGETAKRETFELSYADFYKRLRAGAKFTTSQPEPNAFVEAFRPAIEAGDEVVCVTISSGISGTVNSANLAREMLEPDKISIFDSQQSGFVQASLAIRAKELADQGATRAEIIKALEDMRTRSRVFFVVESLRFLYEGGRLTGIQALIGSVIQVKPIIWFDSEGKMAALEKVRTLKNAKARALELVKERGKRGVEKAGLHYGDNLEEATAYGKEMEEIVGIPVPLIKVSPVISSHTGPDLLGPSIITKR